MENEKPILEEPTIHSTETELSPEIVEFIVNQSKHIHKWRIEEPEGPTSMGCCVGCKEVKEFRNWLQETDFITNAEHREDLGFF